MYVLPVHHRKCAVRVWHYAPAVFVILGAKMCKATEASEQPSLTEIKTEENLEKEILL